MRGRQLWLGVAVALLAAASMSSGAHAQAALTGLVSSSEEGAMEGVLVSAKKEGSTITTTVVTDEQGRYSFPAARMEPGKYTISIRAIGYKLDGPKTVDVPRRQCRHGRSQAQQGQEPGAAALQRRMAAQPSRRRPAEGVSHDVRGLPHAPARVDLEPRRRRIPAGIPADGALLARQHAHPSATAAARPARRAPGRHRRCRQGGRGISRERQPRQFGGDRISAQDRCRVPRAASTKVIVTEYDLPRKGALPHDVIVDKDGQVWYSDFGAQFVGVHGSRRPDTTKDIAIPVVRPEQPKGGLDLEFDPDGNIWLAMMYQAGISKIDRKTHEVSVFPFPKEWISTSAQASMVSPTLFERRRQGMDQQPGGSPQLPARSGDRQVRELRVRPRRPPASRSGPMACPPTTRTTSISWSSAAAASAGATPRRSRSPSGRRRRALSRPAPRPGRRAEPAVVRRIWRQRHRHVRPADRRHQGVAAAHAMERAL